MGTSILMMKTQIGLGVLSIPLVFDTLGMIPGIIILLAIAIITTWVRRQWRIIDIFQRY
jgi:amino acid permease